MTIKQLADDLGVEKHIVKYLHKQLPPNWSIMVNGRVLLSDAAVDAIRRKLSGGELISDIPVPPYNAYSPDGWRKYDFQADNPSGESTLSPETPDNPSGEFTESPENTEQYSENCKDYETISTDFSANNRTKSGESENRRKPEKASESTLALFSLYKAAYDAQLATIKEQMADKNAEIDYLKHQIAVKDSQIDAQAATIKETIASADERLSATQAANAEQLSRMQDTVDALTKQLADAAERERKLQATIEQSREVPRRWWQWWKR